MNKQRSNFTTFFVFSLYFIIIIFIVSKHTLFLLLVHLFSVSRVPTLKKSQIKSEKKSILRFFDESTLCQLLYLFSYIYTIQYIFQFVCCIVVICLFDWSSCRLRFFCLFLPFFLLICRALY